jgi:hypothetical protein
MKSLLSLMLASAVLGAPQAERPKLVVAIIVDQFRYDYLTRFRDSYHGGLHQLLQRGANFTNAFYEQVPTVTAVGHSLFLSGAMPAVSGIVGNSWFDRGEGEQVTSVCDWAWIVVGGHQDDKPPKKCTDADPASPKRLLVTTLGDELRSTHEDSRVIGVSLKARAAILPSGHRAAGAYWFDDFTGNFVTSSFYMDELPDWAREFNGRKLPEDYVKRKWDRFPQWDFHPGADGHAYEKLPASPWGNELVEAFAEQALNGEKLGQRGATDLLTISFSSNDYVGHVAGPDAPEVEDMSIRTDELLGKLFRAIDASVGLWNTVVVLSADHGVATVPDVAIERRLPGGHIAGSPEKVVQDALTVKFGPAAWVIGGGGETSLYLKWNAAQSLPVGVPKPSEEEIYRAAKEALLAAPGLNIARVYTRLQLDGGIAGDFVARAVQNGYYSKRSGDLAVVFDPGYVPGKAGTTHFSPWAYDRHVPLLFMGWGIRPGRYDMQVSINDVAPTLATLLDIQTPSGSSGQVLFDILPGERR